VVNLAECVDPEIYADLFFEIKEVPTGSDEDDAEESGILSPVTPYWEVSVIHRDQAMVKRSIRNFVITKQEMEIMRASAGKTARMHFSNGFVALQCQNLIQILTRMGAGF
jgi:hypothetical protein